MHNILYCIKAMLVNAYTNIVYLNADVRKRINLRTFKIKNNE